MNRPLHRPMGRFRPALTASPRSDSNWNWRRTALECTVLGVGMLTFLPIAVTGDLRLYGIPFVNYLWLIFLVCVSAGVLLNRAASRSALWACAACIVYMGVVGLLHSRHMFFSYADWFRDVLFSSGVFGGCAWGLRLNQVQAVAFERRLFMLASVMLLANQVGIALGVVSAYEFDGRVLDPSQYSSSYFVLGLAAVVIATRTLSRRSSARALYSGMVVAGLASVLWFTLVSVTRSTMILLAAVVGMILWISIPRLKLAGIALFGTCLMLAVISSGGVSLTSAQFGSIGERFTLLHDARSEVRYKEIEDLLSQMPLSERIFGRGFGVGFLSSAAGEDLKLTALNPHVGILSFFQKGGVVVMTIALLPLFAAMRFLLAAKTMRMLKAYSGIVVFFYICASISGGWFITPLFLLGYGIARTTVVRAETLVPRSI